MVAGEQVGSVWEEELVRSRRGRLLVVVVVVVPFTSKAGHQEHRSQGGAAGSGLLEGDGG